MDNDEGRVLSKAQILDHVWQYDWGGDTAIMKSYISYLAGRTMASSSRMRTATSTR